MANLKVEMVILLSIEKLPNLLESWKKKNYCVPGNAATLTLLKTLLIFFFESAFWLTNDKLSTIHDESSL